jgi:hypothetical protein
MMRLAEFRESLAEPAPPPGVAGPLQALWWVAKGDWEEAHRIVQDEAGRDAAWVHAHLHRVEGDLPNARYWYGEARRPASHGPLESEWDRIVDALLVGGAATDADI